MAAIVEHVGTGERFVLLGAGYGMYHSSRPNALLGDMFPTTKEGSEALLAVCNADGKVGWVRSNDVRVVSVDGAPPHTVLA